MSEAAKKTKATFSRLVDYLLKNEPAALPVRGLESSDMFTLTIVTGKPLSQTAREWIRRDAHVGVQVLFSPL